MASSINNHRLIVMEGGDGVGKTSIGKCLAERLQACYLSTPPAGFKPIRSYIENSASYESRFYYYLAGVYDCLDEIKTKLEETHVICDRFVWSSIIGYLALRNLKLDCYSIEKIFGLSELLKIDAITILLTVNENEQMARIEQRFEKGRTDLLSLQNNEFRKRVNELYEKVGYYKNWLIFDTSDKTVELSCSQIITELIVIGGNLIGN